MDLLVGLAIGYVFGLVRVLRHSPDAEHDKVVYPVFVGQGLAAAGLGVAGAWSLAHGLTVASVVATPFVLVLALAVYRSVRAKMGLGIWAAPLVLHALIFAGVIALARLTNWRFV